MNGFKPGKGPSEPNKDVPEHGEEQVRPGSAQADRRFAQERIAANSQKAWRKPSGGAAQKADIPQGGGAPLPSDLRKRMEPNLGADLSGARIHTGGDSAKAAGNLGARAFTVGGDVHFGAGEFSPGSKEGDRLIAHELTHVVQGQKAGVSRKATEGKEGGAAGHAVNDDAKLEAEADSMGAHAVSNPGDPHEHEADSVADKVVDKLHGGDEKAGAGAADKAADVKAAPVAEVSAKRLPGISLAAKPGAAPAKAGPAPAAPAKNGPGAPPAKGGAPAPAPAPNATELELKRTIDDLKKICEEPLKTSAAQLETLLVMTRNRIGFNQGETYKDASTWANNAQKAWDTAKAKYIEARYNKVIIDIDPGSPMIKHLLPAMLVEIEKDKPPTNLFLPRTLEALMNAKDLVARKDAAAKQAVALKDAEAKKKAPGKEAPGDPGKKDEHAAGPAGAPKPAEGPKGGAPKPADGGAKGGAPDGGAKGGAPKGADPAHQPGGGADHPVAAPPAEKLVPPQLKNPAVGINVADVQAALATAEEGKKEKDKGIAPTPPKPAAAAEPPPEEIYAELHAALGTYHPTRAPAAWKKLPDTHKFLLTADDIVRGYITQAAMGAEMHGFSLNPIGVNHAILDDGAASKAINAIKSTARWDWFLKLPPNQGELTKKHQATLRPHMNDQKSAVDLFSKAFPQAHNGPYPGPFAANYLAIPWQQPVLLRLYDALANFGLSAAHIGAGSGGFYLVSQELQNGQWGPAGGAWYDSNINACAFGTKDVDYGSQAQNKDKKTAHNANEGYMPFFEGAALHEVGHAVGAKFGGDGFAVTRNEFKTETPESWSQALFKPGMGSSIKRFFKGKKALQPEDARKYMAGFISVGAGPLPPGFTSAAAVESELESTYKSDVLYKYYQHLKAGRAGYQFADIDRCQHDGRVFYENTTFAQGLGSRFVSCKAETVLKRVSVYSLASEKEWFAENYLAYYKTPQALGSMVASDVKGYLDALHKDPAAGAVAQGGQGAKAPTKAEGNKPEGEKHGGDQEQAQQLAEKKSQQLKRFAFPVKFG